MAVGPTRQPEKEAGALVSWRRSRSTSGGFTDEALAMDGPATDESSAPSDAAPPPGELVAACDRLLASAPRDLPALLEIGRAAIHAPKPSAEESPLLRVPARVLAALRESADLHVLLGALEEATDELTTGLDAEGRRSAPSSADAHAHPGDHVLRLFRVQREAQWLRRVAALAEQQASSSSVREVIEGLDAVEVELARLAPDLYRGADPALAEAFAAAQAGLRHGRIAAARGKLTRYVDAVHGLREDPDAPLDRCWHAVAVADEHVAEAREALLTGDPDAGGPLDVEVVYADDQDTVELQRAVDGVRSARRELMETVRARLHERPAKERVVYLIRWADQLADGAANTLGFAEEAGRDIALTAVALKQEAADRLREDLSIAQAAVERPERRQIRRAARKLSRVRRQLRAESDELQVRAGLAARYGPGFPATLERTALALIAVVVGLFLLDLTVLQHLGRRARLVVDLVDGLLCIGLLCELGLRVRFAPHRWRYLARHAITDLLPALPFGLLAHGVQALAPTSGLAARMAAVGSGHRALEEVRLTRVVWVLRLPRLARTLRAIRPFVRLVRLFGLFQRSLDHVVRRARRRLDRDIVLFPEPRTHAVGPPPLELRLAGIARRAHRARRRAAQALRPTERARALCRLAARWHTELAALPPPTADLTAALDDEDPGELPPGVERRRAPEIDLRQIIANLVRADATSVEEGLGRALGERLGRLVRLFDVPGLRRIGPIRRALVREDGLATDPLEAAAQAARELGHLLDRLLAIVLFFADLRGIVTGPQLVDRVGSTLIRATEKPAKRLLAFGLLFVCVYLLVKGLGFVLLGGVFRWINKVLVTPVIVVGAIAFVLMQVGRWFRRVAGEATDVYARVAEAQYYNLLVYEKRRYLADDLGELWQRVLRPEAAGDAALRALEEDQILAALQRAVRRDDLTHALAGTLSLGANPSDSAGEATPGASVRDTLHRLLLLYQDYLTGAPLHPSDTKTTQQLLGNLTLRSIVAERLKLRPKAQRALAKLDLERTGGLVGPHIWFHFITLALTEQTAKLVMDYNRYCVPKSVAEAPGGPPQEHREWLARRRHGAEAESAEERRRRDRERQALDHYQSTAFDALDFLTVTPEADARVAQRFGDEVTEILRRDRTALARTIFGSYPLHRLPRSRRVLNPYVVYTRYLAGGRIALLPLRAMVWLAQGIGLAARNLGTVIRDVVLRRFSADSLEGEGDPDACLRKVHRMREPIYMACVLLRSQFDPEYLGALTPHAPAGTAGTATWREDLAAIRASEREHRELRLRRRAVAEARVRFARLLREEPALFAHRPPDRDDAPLDHESLRAAWTAYAIDYEGVQTTLDAPQRIEQAFARAARDRRHGVRSLPARILRAGGRAVVTLFGHREDARARSFRLYWETRSRRRVLDAADSARERELAWQTYLENPDGMRSLVDRLSAQGGVELARRSALQRLKAVLENPSHWTHQLVTLRTVQTLSTFDLRNYRDLVLGLAYPKQAALGTAPGEQRAEAIA